MDTNKEYVPNYYKAQNSALKLLRDNAIVDTFVPVVKIAKSLDLTVIAVDTEEYSGKIDFNQKMISVKSNDIESRQRFTIAHEIGHYKLHKGMYENGQHAELYRGFVYDEDKDKDPREREADVFAANLLVPLELLKEYVDNPKANIDTLSKLFGVSHAMMANRLSFYYGMRNKDE